MTNGIIPFCLILVVVIDNLSIYTYSEFLTSLQSTSKEMTIALIP